MWRNVLGRELKLDQPNTASKRLILSVLNSTATKREAKDYLKKYSNEPSVVNHCLLFIRGLSGLNESTAMKLSGSIKRLRMLGLRPICVLPPGPFMDKEAELLDTMVTWAALKPLHLREALTETTNGSYRSLISSNSRLFDDTVAGTVPIIKPYVYNESSASEYLSRDIVKFMRHFSEGSSLLIDKFFILNAIGGTPSPERNGNAHVFVNLSQEFESLKGSLEEQVYLSENRQPDSEDLVDRMRLHIYEDMIVHREEELKEHIQDLELMNCVLSNLSSGSTGLITSIKSASVFTDTKNPLLYNLLTDRSLISSSLPRFKNKNAVQSHTAIKDEHDTDWDSGYNMPTNKINDAVFDTTVYKKGVDIKIFDYRKLTQHNSIGLPAEFIASNEPIPEDGGDFKLDLNKMKHILDKSFNRSLDLSHYLRRINGRIASVIVIGNYEGIAILTYEGPEEKQFVYLDKFAVLPQLKGSLGISDIIFNLMFKKFPREVLWRSRKDNVVNKWYFQRSVAVIDLSTDLGNNDQVESNFKMFYYGDDGANLEKFGSKGTFQVRLKEFARYIRDIKPSWEK